MEGLGMRKRSVDIIIPAYNEEDCINELSERLVSLFVIEKSYKFRVIIIENGSIDSTWSKIIEICKSDKRFTALKLSRNFRMDGGLTAGLDQATADACVLMTADLQDPPELISEFLRLWEKGWENIYGIVTKRGGTGLIRTMNSKLFYWVAEKLTDGRIPKNASDFRLVDKKVYESVRSMKERNRFMRGLFAWVGFASIGVPMHRPPRFGGESKAHTFKVIDLALKGIFAHSYKPLKFISIIGIFMSISSFMSLIPLLFIWVKDGVPFAGFGSIISTLLLLIGILFLLIGVLSEYVGLVYEEVKSRPNFIISDKI